ncbi:glucose-6-phosphate dehydrogenase [Pleionea mediterranea]|jgi:glucose-6-phosphate 1-dehydrogenase|uniref:Glucose-6-phosphate 1-dehydrogenase n=1 Tax=Pleionea mediterranea TaxID=523701 RepID=A0A316FRL6_9GAMM|nr:glucose-6-phosphate dehydrogenase [Pleionea mediterranea]PWK50805.1 glucose-6-phosphate 1-dehydrogenase [Pleionea mediterranea]
MTFSINEKACNLILFGGNGDLSYRKLLPALFNLERKEMLHDDLNIIGCSRTELSDEVFQSEALEGLKENATSNPDESPEITQRFLNRLSFLSVDASDTNDFQQLKQHLSSLKGNGCHIYYLATPPGLFVPICQHLEAVGLVNDKSRLIIEKPIGYNLDSSIEINDQVAAVFAEDNIYRIDHYMGKSAVQNLLALRFANVMFEPLWNQNYIDHVQITVSESVGVGNRKSFYDNVGALRDMVQNHLLQLLALIAMEPPTHLNPEALKHEKIKVFRSLRPIEGKRTKYNTVRGQYSAGELDGESLPAYNQEGDNPKPSNTESFVALKVDIDNWRWSGVPFYLRTGKRLSSRYAEIDIQFKEIHHSIFKLPTKANRLIIRLQPKDSIQLMLMNQEPNLSGAVNLVSDPLNLSFTDQYDPADIPKGYERLLYDCIIGDPTLFMSRYEVEEAWRWTDTILAGWEEFDVPVLYYPAGSMGPDAAEQLLAKDGRKWFNNNEHEQE